MFKYVCKLSLVTAKCLKFGGFYFGFTWYNMPVVKVLVVQIKLDTILPYSKQIQNKRVSAPFLPFQALISIWAASCCLFIKFYQKIEFDVLS